MTDERKELLLEALQADMEFTKEIIPMGAEEMTKALNGKGYDFTEEEVAEMGEIFKKVASQCMKEDGEIDEELLEQVVGGGKGAAIIGIILFVGLAISVGY